MTVAFLTATAALSVFFVAVSLLGAFRSCLSDLWYCCLSFDSCRFLSASVLGLGLFCGEILSLLEVRAGSVRGGRLVGVPLGVGAGVRFTCTVSRRVGWDASEIR